MFDGQASARTNAYSVTTQVDLAAKPAANSGACERSVAIEAPPSKISTNEAKFSSAIVGTDRLLPLRLDGRSSTAAILATLVPDELQSVRIGATPTAQQLVGVSTSFDSTISMRINHSLQCGSADSLSLGLGEDGESTFLSQIERSISYRAADSFRPYLQRLVVRVLVDHQDSITA